MKKYFRFICLALLLPIVMQIAMPMLAADVASNAKTIRVGYMNHPGFIEERDGEFFGYGVEYFNEICKYAGWNIEYKYGLWKDQLEMLENGEIDIVPLAQRTDERAEKYLYSEQPMGLIQCLLLTLPESENNINGNALDCNGKKIGILKGSRNIELLKRYSEQMGFEYEKAEYDSQRELEQALLNGEVAIIACEQMVEAQNLRILDRFASDPYYLITRKDDTELMSELNYVIIKMNAYDPTYTARLYQKYFDKNIRGISPYFTSEEIAYINSHREITLAVIPDNVPLAYTDENGEMVGIIPDIMSIISKLCGISFNYEYVPQDITPMAFLQEHPTYLGTGMLASNPAFKEEMLVSDVYYTTYAALVAHGPNSKKLELENKNYSIAVPKSFQSMRLFIKENYPNFEIKDCLSVEDGLKALEKESVDLFSYTINLITPYLSNPIYGDIYMVDTQFMPCPLCNVGVMNPENEILIGILNKCIPMISETDIARLEGTYFYNNTYHYNDNDVLYRFQTVIIPIAVSIAVIIFSLLLFLWLRQRKFNKDITFHAEYDMMTGLYNRTALRKKAMQMLEKDNGRNCAFLVFDIDDLNKINELNGHSAGDEVIKTIADIIDKQFRGSTTAIGRIGGDEFAALLVGMESKSLLISALASLQKTIGTATVNDIDTMLGVSIGIKLFKAGSDDIDDVFRHANMAMQLLKSDGKNGFAFYSEQNTMSYKAIYGQAKLDDKEENATEYAAPAVYEANEEPVGSHAECDSDFRKLIEAFPNISIYVIAQNTHEMLYYNKRFKEICPNATIGQSCRNLSVGPCKNCIVDTMGEQSMAHTIYYSAVFGDEVEITAKK